MRPDVAGRRGVRFTAGDFIPGDSVVGCFPAYHFRSIPWHDHDCYELAIVTAGSGVHAGADEAAVLNPGTIVFVPPGVGHEYRDCPDNVVVAPRPPAGLAWACASVETARGRVATEWRIDDEGLRLDVELPAGARATVRPPVTERSTVSLDGRPAAGELALTSGRHTVVVTGPAVADPGPIRR